MQRALRMYKGTPGKGAYTLYDASVIDKALEEERDIIIVNRKTGTLLLVPNDKIRRCHRRSLTDAYSDLHDHANEGKYIDLDCVQGKEVKGADQLNPYLGVSGISYTIIEFFKRNIGLDYLKILNGIQLNTPDLGPVVHWEGRRNKEGLIVFSDWWPLDKELLDACCKFNPKLVDMLRKSKSGRQDAKNRMTPLEKFIHRIQVMARCRWHTPVRGGMPIPSGGVYPYGIPIEQFEMVIDDRFMTYDIDALGNESAIRYVRLGYGRRDRHVLSKRNWWYEGPHSPFAYVDERIRARAVKVHKKTVA